LLANTELITCTEIISNTSAVNAIHTFIIRRELIHFINVVNELQ
jgi:hypothetical protein